jgi:hypothetical protein
MGEALWRCLPTALPTDQAMKFMETAMDFFVWPAMFLGELLIVDWRSRMKLNALP